MGSLVQVQTAPRTSTVVELYEPAELVEPYLMNPLNRLNPLNLFLIR